MLALCLMLLGTYYAQNYASIIGGCLDIKTECRSVLAIAIAICSYNYVCEFTVGGSNISLR